LKRFGISDEKAFGLDKSDVIVEQIPLLYQPINTIDLKREEHE
jgi:KUP system potassium uptake protein